MSLEENKQFVRRHFEEFVNQKRLEVSDKNFAAHYQEHGADARPGVSSRDYLAAVFKRYPDIRVTIEDIIAEDDKVVVRNTWRATDSTNGEKITFSGIVIWRLANGQLAERWAYLEAPHPVR